MNNIYNASFAFIYNIPITNRFQCSELIVFKRNLIKYYTGYDSKPGASAHYSQLYCCYRDHRECTIKNFPGIRKICTRSRSRAKWKQSTEINCAESAKVSKHIEIRWTMVWCDDKNARLGKHESMYNSQSVQNVIIKMDSIFYYNLYLIAEE